MRNYLFIFFFVLANFVIAQDNIFHDRNFWKQNPSIEKIEILISQGNDISSLNSNAFDAVTWALIEKVDNETVKYLLSKEGNGVNKLTHDGRTYIFWAAYKDNLEMMKYLVDRGAKTDIIDSHGYSVFNFAATTGQQNIELYDFLIENGAKPTEEINHNGANAILLIAPFVSDFRVIDYFESLGLDKNSKDEHGNGSFNYAAKGGNISFLEALIEKDYDYKTLNKFGGNAFMMASQGRRGHTNSLKVYQFLDNIGLESNIVGKDGKSPLHNIAYRNSDVETIKFFLNQGMDVNLQDINGNTPFINASRSNSIAVVKLLRPFVTDINRQNQEGQSALTLAFRNNSVEVVNYLLENGADINIIDKKGNSLPYYLLNSFNNKDQFEAKLKILKGNSISLRDTQQNGNTLLHEAILMGNKNLVERVLPFRININAKNDEGNTALHLAAMKAKNEDILRLLITNGADKSIKTEFEESVYDLALENELLKLDKTNIEFLK